MGLSGSWRFAHSAALVAVVVLLLVVGTLLEGEAERDQSPVNAGLLTALLLASFLWASAGWSLAYDPRHAAPCSLGVPGGPSFEAAREDEAFLSVFRL
jgi:hypothetical protein